MSKSSSRRAVVAVMGLVATLALAGCATDGAVAPATSTSASKDGKVSYEAIPADKANQLKESKGQHTFGAQPIENPPPVYPPELVSANLAATIRAKVIVDGEGKVTDVRDLDTMGGDHHGAFFAAVREATMRWTYTPMTVVKDNEDARGKFNQTKTTQPFSLDYSFRFELKDGMPTVTATR
ncbi:hypothetical protein [Luteibacter sp.]|uniref:hypothetical protein n=1 Tax=Luteibacter sp. TaxID=1886636 RepID=UPI002F424AD3